MSLIRAVENTLDICIHTSIDWTERSALDSGNFQFLQKLNASTRFPRQNEQILVKISIAYSNLYNAAYKIHPWRSYLHISIQSSSSTWNIHNNQPKASKNSSDSLQLIFGAHRAFLICGPGDLAKHPCLNYVTNTNWWCERVSTCSEQLNKFHEKHKRHCKVSEKVTHNANGCSWSPKRLLDQARNEK